MYKSIAEYYEKIFPVSLSKKKFITSELFDSRYNVILDIGCATGELTNLISSSFDKIWGIDNDEKMISLASKRYPKDNITFSLGDILTLNSTLQNNLFDAIICLGNTLVHINSLDNINRSLKNIYDSLHHSGKIVIQIVNYDRIIKKNIKNLPTKETDDFVFSREYILRSGQTNNINFHTTLILKNKNITIENNILLYPLKYDEINSILNNIGFRNIKHFGNYQKEIYNKIDSQGLIVTATKF